MLEYPDVTNISTKEKETRHDAWFFGPSGHPDRPSGAASTPAQGASAFGSLKLHLAPMLPRQYRLNRVEIASVLRRGAATRGEGLMLRVARLPEMIEATHLAIVVSAKTVKAATGRNLLKRRLRHAVRLLASKLKPGYGAVVVTSRPAPSQTFTQLQTILESLLKQSGLLLI